MCVPRRTTDDAVEVGASFVLATLKMSYNGSISSLVSMATAGYYISFSISHKKSEVKLSRWPMCYLVYKYKLHMYLKLPCLQV